MKKKKIFIWLGVVLFLVLSIHIVLIQIFGCVDYKGTLTTKYKRNAASQTITTSHFEIETPKGWVHIFHGYGCEGEACGTFLTKHGDVTYEYGIFANPLVIDSIFVFSGDSLKAGRFEVFVGRDENHEETGIHIFCQHEMQLPLSFFMSKACTNNIDDLVAGIASMQFKKFYSFSLCPCSDEAPVLETKRERFTQQEANSIFDSSETP